MLQDCIITSWQGSAGVFAPSLPIQNLSLPDCHGTRYSVYSLVEVGKVTWLADGTASRPGVADLQIPLTCWIANGFVGGVLYQSATQVQTE